MTDTNWQLDPTSPIPLHQQFETRIREHIQSGEWTPGSQIPSERELMQRSGISRATVRQALGALVHEGVLKKEHGRGTFVRQTRFEQPMAVVYSFSEQLRSLGVRLEDVVLEQKQISAPFELAHQLGTAVGDPLIYLKRLRRVNGTPMMVSIAWMPYELCPALLDQPFEGSLYVQLTTRHNLPVLSATDRLEAIAADRSVAQLLDVPRGTPLMFVERTAYTTHQVVLHIGYNSIRGDMCVFRSDMPLAFKIPDNSQQKG
jgi:GntR family transcriptional regulator